MKKLFHCTLLLLLFSCNNESAAKKNSGGDSTVQNMPAPQTATNTATGCGNALLFHEGAVMEAKTYNAAGNTTMISTAKVVKVADEGGETVAQVASKTSNPDGSGEKTMTMSYKCDGKNLVMDIASLLGDNKKDMTIEGSGFSFPVNITEEQVLPDVSYSMTIDKNGKKVKVTSIIKNRKVTGKETVTIPGGSFTCYKIASEIDATTEMPGMDEKMKQVMESMKSKMPKSTMVMWYAPEATVLKSEFYQGDKLVTRNEVTAVKQ